MEIAALSPSEFTEQLRSLLHRHRVAGASVAVYHQGVTQTASGGTINVTTGVELTDDTVMHIGSIAKIFTATLVMQLVDEGRLALDDLVAHHLPELTLQSSDARERITVKMLLNHTSGIDGDVQPDHGHDEETIEKTVRRFSEIGQIHEPGAEFSYCNGGFVIAGYLVQRLTGRSWYRLVRDRIYRPLGMQNAATLPEEALLYRTSVGHFLDEETQSHVRTSVSLLPLGFSPGGTTLMMSASDLLSFARTHMNDGMAPTGARILSTNSARLMRQQTTICDKPAFASSVGLSWMQLADGGFAHGGGAPGAAARIYIDPRREFAAVILTNSEHGAALINYLLASYVQCATRSSSPQGHSAFGAQLTHSREVNLDSCVGVYENILSHHEIVRLADGLGIRMYFKFPLYDNSKTQASAVCRLVPLENGDFLLKPGADLRGATLPSSRPLVFSFRNPDASGRMRHLAASNGRLYRRIESTGSGA